MNNNEVFTSVEAIDYIYKNNKELNNCSIEIINSCIFKCDHCYMPNNKSNMMDFDLYKKIIDELEQIGCLWILITGGEPLLHPKFKDFYIYAKEHGFLVSVNTNGYLINDEIIELFKKYEPYAVEISLYGYDEKTYDEFTHFKNGFTMVDNNIKKLLNNNINLNLKSVLVKNNYKYFNKIREYANKFDCPFRYDYVIFPKVNNTCNKPNSELLSTDVIIKVLKNDNDSYTAFKERFDNINQEKNDGKVFKCSAGEDGIYIDSYGNINMCIAIMNDKYNINNISIQKARKEFKKSKNMCISYNYKCENCYKKSICRYCPGRFKLETGSYIEPPEWYCNTANAIIDEFCVDGFIYHKGNLISDIDFENMFSLLKENYKDLYEIKQDDFLIWKNNVKDSDNINTYILKENNNIIGYIQYVKNENDICLSEIQIKDEYKGDKKTFKKLIRDFIILSGITSDTIVYGNINPNNSKSKNVFTHIGFVNKNGNRYDIIGKILIDKYL